MYVPFGLQTYEVERYEQPLVTLENWYAEPAPELQTRSAKLVPTPGLVASGDTIAGTPGAIFQSGLLFGSDAVISAGTTVYRRSANGTVSTIATGLPAATIRPKFAATQFPELVLVQGGTAHLVGTSSATAITIGAASGDIIDVTTAGQRHLFIESGSGRVHVSDTADASTVNAFLTAEADPDPALAIEEFGGNIYVFGARTTQIARLTGNDTTPLRFVPTIIPKGIYGARCYAKGTDDLYFVGDDARVYGMRFGIPREFNTRPINRLLQNVAVADRDSITMATWSQDNTEFLLLTIPNVGQYVYDTKTALWHRRKRQFVWHGGVGPILNIDGGVFCLEEGSTGGPLLKLDPEVYTDKGDPIVRVATAPLPIEDGRINIKALNIEVFAGIGLDGNQQGSEPIIELRVAEDGRSYADPMQRSLGGPGEYRKRVIFGPLGTFNPGMPMFQITCSDPVPVAVMGAYVNPQART